MNRSEGQWTQPELTLPVHRGLNKTGIGQVNTSSLGMHWSADKHTANLFAAKHDTIYGEPLLQSYKPSTVVHADVPLRNVETDTPTLKRKQVDLKGETNEQEVPVKSGSNVQVTGLTRITWPSTMRERQRKRTYNPPREMKA